MIRTWRSMLFVLLALTVIGTLMPSAAFGREALAWTKGYTMVVTDSKTIEETYQAANFIRSKGGRVGIIVPPRVMLGSVPEDIADSLVGKFGVRSIHTKPVSIDRFRSLNLEPEEEDAVGFFNRVASGELARNSNVSAPIPSYEGKAPDGLAAPAIDYDAYLRNLESAGLNPDKLREIGIEVSRSDESGAVLSPGNSDAMVGTIAYSAILLQSVGGASQYVWTQAHVDLIIDQIFTGLNFWVDNSYLYGVPVTWVVTVYTRFNTTNVNTTVEPINQGSDDFYVNQVMCNFGFCSGDKFARTTAFNTARRLAVHTNWASLVFVPYNPVPAPDGFGYAYINGPYSVTCFRAAGWGETRFNQVVSHETGHLHGNWDEYGASGCNDCATPRTNGVFNGNCQNCNASSVPCRMRFNEFDICPYTPGHLGWSYVIDDTWTESPAPNRRPNFTPGQGVRYVHAFNFPGRPGQTHTLTWTFFINFFGTPTQVCGPFSGAISTNGYWYAWCDWTIPGGAQLGPATFAVVSTISNYGRSVRNSNWGEFYITGPGANPVGAQGPPAGGVAKLEDYKPE